MDNFISRHYCLWKKLNHELYMKKWILLISAIVILLGVMFFTKPDNKACTIAAVEAVWGDIVPDKYKRPQYFEQFMDLNSPSVTIQDWVFFKRIQYQFGDKRRTIGYGVFNQCYCQQYDLGLR